MALTRRFPLKVEYWFVTHKREFQRWWNILFIIFDAALLLYVLVTIILYLVLTPRSLRQVEAMGHNVVDAPALTSSLLRPQQLVTQQVQVIPTTEGFVDILTRVRNPNTHWYISELSYLFQVGGERTEAQQTYLAPGEEKYIVQPTIPTAAYAAIYFFGRALHPTAVVWWFRGTRYARECDHYEREPYRLPLRDRAVHPV
jgi:hypothetical protein